MYDTDYHPAQLHPLDADYSKEHAQPPQERDKEREPAGEKEQEKHFKGATHTDSRTSSHTQGGCLFYLAVVSYTKRTLASTQVLPQMRTRKRRRLASWRR